MKLTDIFNILVESGLFAVLLGLVISGIKYAKTYLDAKTAETAAKIKNENIKNAVKSAEDCISTVVLELSQTVVDDLKRQSADGKLTQAEADKIKQTAVEKVNSLLSTNVRDTLNTVYGDLNEWIKSKIEADVKSNKMAAH
jgi:hypothetical protein